MQGKDGHDTREGRKGGHDTEKSRAVLHACYGRLSVRTTRGREDGGFVSRCGGWAPGVVYTEELDQPRSQPAAKKSDGCVVFMADDLLNDVEFVV